ncbi:MAG: Sua5/YciO/YrdC/YwlC family protein [Actinomycetaceae bacterium]|nr:Sua5/YciO/YrdC/YwlC family protein [Actinomycetaceae bacterium]
MDDKNNASKVEEWTGTASENAVAALAAGGGLVVAPTKVGYILMAADGPGLERKFEAKIRKREKPGVVLCSSMEQLEALAELTPEVRGFYQKHWDDDILLGCILPWRSDAEKYLPDESSRELARDRRETSCFIIRFGRPAEQIVTEMWSRYGKLTFASSANPSGIGNRGRVEGIGERIESAADVIVSADGYVRSIQPGASDETRYEQGVMVSMVDDAGRLVPEQHGERGVLPAPTLIRKGLDYEAIMRNLAEAFPSWDFRQGMYY